MLLATRSWVDSRSIEDNNVWNLFLFDILENINDFSIEFHHLVVLVIKVISLRQMASAIENYFSGLGRSLLSEGNLVVEILWDWLAYDFCDLISWDTVGLHTQDPVVNFKTSFSSLLDDDLKPLN